MGRLWILAAVVLFTTAPALAATSAEGPPPTAASPPSLAVDTPASPVAAPSPRASADQPAPPTLPAPAHSPISLWQFLAGLASAVLAGLVSALFAPMMRDWWTQRKDAKISGLRLALLLEDHAIRCASVYSDTHDALQRHEIRQGGPAPLPDYPEDTAWRAMGYKLTEIALLFPVQRADLISAAYGGAEHLDLPTLVEEIADASLDIGWSAIATAEALRSGLKLPPATHEGLSRTKAFLAERRENKAVQRARIEAIRAKAKAADEDPDDLLA